MNQLEEPEGDRDDVWQRAADQASADIRRARSSEEARASFLEKLADLERRNGKVTRKEAQELWSAAKVAAALTK
jgi:hypothetical protein